MKADSVTFRGDALGCLIYPRSACDDAISPLPLASPFPARWTGTHLLRTGVDAARFLAEAPGRVAAVGNRAEADFRREASAIGITPREIGIVTGLNYTRGRWVTLILYQTAS